MFEFEDSKLGRIKVVNITEARSEMATIMNDHEFNYVITKNNRPVRAIVSYDAYRRSQTALSGKGQKSPAQKDSIKGLIQSREEDLKKLDQLKEEEPQKAVAVGQNAPPVPVGEPYIPRNPPEDTDYFSKFKKLYEAPDYESLFRSGPPLTSESPPSVDRQEKEILPSEGYQGIPEPPLEDELSRPRERHRNEPPSIQDLLADLEGAKLSDEE